ncbi:MAG: SUMF1/EgtB/PvdO family nonheme iron enzyme [Saprospiraceae bacterium]|nr:SUMF1/EgtB/PvdO family nonheme iron enzyme [Saprospiraceae bacterium]
MHRRKGDNRVQRGGSWINNAQNCRSSNRNNNAPTNRNNNVGFRLVLVSLPAHRRSGGQPLNRRCSRSPGLPRATKTRPRAARTAVLVAV